MEFGHEWKDSHNPILRGLKRYPWLLTTYKSWDDPASGGCFKDSLFLNALKNLGTT